MDLNEPSIDRLRLKLRYKVLYHVGHNCADVDDLVQESLARFFRAEQRHSIRNTEEFGAFLNGVCRNVILEYRRGSARAGDRSGHADTGRGGQAGGRDSRNARRDRQWFERTGRTGSR